MKGQIAESSARTTQIRGRFIRDEVLAWVGAIGAAITLLGAVEPLLQLANWAHYLVQHWEELTTAFWRWAVSYIRIRIPITPSWAALPTANMFFLTITFASLRASKGNARFELMIDLALSAWFSVFFGSHFLERSLATLCHRLR
jgi:hypothetical protein